MTRRARLVIAVLVALTLVAGALMIGYLFAGRPAPKPAAASGEPALSLQQVLGGTPGDGFARARQVRHFDFPADHGAHPDFRSEWWYFTGNLADPAGRRFGYELTFFRFALRPPGANDASARADSAWATRQAWMAHFAITDVAGQGFTAFQRFERGALGLAGAEADPFAVWLDNWSVRGQVNPACGGCLTATLEAGSGDVAIKLELDSRKPVVLQGEDGLSRKSDTAGNASYYYSLTRLASHGTLRIGDATFAVTGNSWLDREWSTSALGPDVVGWDWFSLQLDDDRELMYYQLRRKDGSADPFSAGRLVAADGRSVTLTRDDVELSILAHWHSPDSGADYPAGWRLKLADGNLDLVITPLLDRQELNLGFRYWEGACRVEGTINGRSISGHGYVELTGYASDAPPR